MHPCVLPAFSMSASMLAKYGSGATETLSFSRRRNNAATIINHQKIVHHNQIFNEHLTR